MFLHCGTAMVFVNAAGALSNAGVTFPSGTVSACNGAAMGDLTNDGTLDVWLSDGADNTSQLLVNVGPLSYSLALTWGVAGAAVFHDVNGDGVLDVPSIGYINPLAPSAGLPLLYVRVVGRNGLLNQYGARVCLRVSSSGYG